MTKQNRAVAIWLYIVAGLIMLMVVLGGFVRLTRSGLSIVEWNPISGIVPPIGEAAWQAEFAKYQQTPEYQHINHQMTLDEYKRIFTIEYVHRLLGRAAGLIVAVPLLYFLIRGIIPWRRSGVYVAIALLFAFQGYLGWYMVSSGLENVPAVSPYRLTIHLLMALFLLALTLWMAWQQSYGFPQRVKGDAPLVLVSVVLAVLTLQISYGGLMAGLKAGHVSNTWPLMFGTLVPAGLLSQVEPWWRNLVTSQTTVHFIHRWLAFAVLAAAGWLYAHYRRRASTAAVRGSLWLLALTVLQIALGVSVIWFNVTLWLALAHQAVAMFMFVAAAYVAYQLSHAPAAAEVGVAGQADLTLVDSAAD